MSLKLAVLCAIFALARAGHLAPALNYAVAPAITTGVAHGAPIITSQYRTEVLTAPAVRYAIGSTPIVRSVPTVAHVPTTVARTVPAITQVPAIGTATIAHAPIPVARYAHAPLAHGFGFGVGHGGLAHGGIVNGGLGFSSGLGLSSGLGYNSGLGFSGAHLGGYSVGGCQLGNCLGGHGGYL